MEHVRTQRDIEQSRRTDAIMWGGGSYIIQKKMEQLSPTLKHILKLEDLRKLRKEQESFEDMEALQAGIESRVWNIMAKDRDSTK